MIIDQLQYNFVKHDTVELMVSSKIHSKDKIRLKNRVPRHLRL